MSVAQVRDEVVAALLKDGRADWPGLGHFERQGAQITFTPGPSAAAELRRLASRPPGMEPEAPALVDARPRLDVPGFGAFVLSRQSRYEGRHPVTKALIVVEASEEVLFEPS